MTITPSVETQKEKLRAKILEMAAENTTVHVNVKPVGPRTVEMRAKLVQVKFGRRYSKDDRLFYWGPLWEASFISLDGTTRFEIMSTRIQIGPLRIIIGGFWQ